mmetsp:Transcript_4514/g.6595  ORF Transcript_4514/g.6595 Transcript_4514/m.6595 type:complete len:168 (-) Transcript_4514:30-533(-)
MKNFTACVVLTILSLSLARAEISDVGDAGVVAVPGPNLLLIECGNGSDMRDRKGTIEKCHKPEKCAQINRRFPWCHHIHITHWINSYHSCICKDVKQQDHEIPKNGGIHEGHDRKLLRQRFDDNSDCPLVELNAPITEEDVADFEPGQAKKLLSLYGVDTVEREDVE